MILRIIRFQILISIASVAFYWSGFVLFSSKYMAGPARSSLFIFCATFLAYNLPVITKYVKSPREHKIFISLYAFFSFLVLYISIGFGMIKFIYLLHLGIISFAYNYPFKSNRWVFLPTRSIPFLKIILIAYVWASIGSILPLFQFDIKPSFHHELGVFIIQFLFIAAITLPFDIRDFSRDKDDHIKTIPGFFGIRVTRIAGIIVSACYIMVSILTLQSAIPFIIIGFVMMILILHSKEERKDIYYTGIIDGFIIIYWLILYLCSQMGLV